MKKIFFYPCIAIILLSVTSCATNITKLNTSGPYTYKINARGVSKNIQTETINTANNLCRSMDKDYKFIRNIILPKSVMGMDMISYDLIFSCVDPGSAQMPPPHRAKEDLWENLRGPETLPDSEQKQTPIVDLPEKEKKVAVIKAVSQKNRKPGATGDTPGQPESLGGPPPSNELELKKEEGNIIEEIIFE
ncbi:MAG: hypothetical protein KKC76_21370 [Proteobacteria bacterium]|nr:hypothetical protein [Pseudomonadota bacterium]MBU4296503.1 hypothetical protein [Pseudomonadota bacterium]MCG2745980.1 hypothetical protein [Desulfobulbaceae bacterium]